MGNRLHVEINKVESHRFENGKLVLYDTDWEIRFFDDYETHSVPVPEDFFERIASLQETEFYQYLLDFLLKVSSEFTQILQAHREKGVCVCGYFLDSTELPPPVHQ